MASQDHLPTFTVAIYVGLVAGLVVFAVAFTMLRVYAFRSRLSTVTTSASYDANAELRDATNNALIATTLSVLGSPLPDFPDEKESTRKTSVLLNFRNGRWEQMKSFIARIHGRGRAVLDSLCQRLADRRARKPKSDPGVSQSDVEIATPCNRNFKSPMTPNPSTNFASQLSSKFQLSLFRSPTADKPEVGMI